MQNTPPQTTIPALELRRQLGRIIKQVVNGRQHFIVTKDEIPVIAIIPIELYQKLKELYVQNQ